MRGKLTAALMLNALSSGSQASQGSAQVELAILHLFDRYNFDFDQLNRILLEKGHSCSFSKLKYQDIAPRVGLNPGLEGNDMRTFDIHRARIPTSLFKDIVEDVEIAMNKYGTLRDQKNGEATSRYLSSLFSRIVALFQSTIRHIPGSVISSSTKGRIEYHFRVLHGLSLLFVQVTYGVLGKSTEHLDAIAQVIAECEALDFANNGKTFPPAIVYGVLCDGTNFEFFSFEGTDPPTFSRGVVRTPSSSKQVDTLSIASYHGTSDAQFIFSLRPICETLFYFFLLAYKNGIEAHMPAWGEALGFAEQTLTLATEAATKAAAHDSTANNMAETALECLQNSLSAVPDFYKEDINLLRSWDENDVELC